jgi:UDP-2,3-diacylglucosamine hydrolase
MPETLFIADLHLDSKWPTKTDLSLKFLAGRARQAEELYILGDLFEVWLGDDDDDPHHQLILTALHQLTMAGIAVSVMPGNRDFLLGTDFVRFTGCQLLADPSMIELYGIPTLLMHGDTLCTQDVDYQQFRQKVRQPLWQQQFLAQPLEQRRLLAKQVRTYSQTKTQTTAEFIMDVTAKAVITVLEAQNVHQLIHGHTHRAGQHHLEINGLPAYRWVVGAWQQHEATILSCTPSGCQLEDFVNY